MKVNLAE